MDFELSHELCEIRSAMRKALERLAPRREEFLRAVHKEKRFPQEVWDAYAETGLFGALLPEEYGGTNMGLLAMTIATEEAARMGFGNAIVMLTAMDSLCILRNGSEALKRRFLPEVAEGKLKFSFAVTEPDAGSNTFRLKTIARRDGDSYILTGQKTFITGVDHTDYMLLVARTTPIEEVERQGASKAFGLSLFLVPPRSPGIELRPIPTRGIEGMTQYTVFLDNVRVPADLLVGEEGMGSFALFNTLNPERILASATACGITDWLIERACAYARERKVFKDRPIGAYQAIQHPLAECRIALDAARLLTYRAAWAFDKSGADMESSARVGMYANMAKLTAADLALRACDQAIETLGGYGFSEEYGVIYLWDAVRLLKTAPITREMILNYVAEHVLELPRSY
jgi:alkylation response protein AidB-like acyl-CoA dehydrogenase